MMLNLGDAFHMPILEQYASDAFHESFRDPRFFSLASIQLNNYEIWIVLALLQDETFWMARDVESIVENRLVEYATFSPASRAYYRTDHRWRSFLVRTGRLQGSGTLHNAAVVTSMVAQ